MRKPLNKKTRGIGEAYRPLSKIKNLSVDTPDTMGAEIAQSLARLNNAVGDVDEFVRKKLKYKNNEELSKAFAAEQVDAIALAIYNIEYKKQSLIVGDQTGVGKGRIAAGMIRYAVMNGMLPIFVTEKPSLFTDIYRDLYDIGCEDASQKLKIKKTEEEKVVKYKKWDKLTDEEKEEYENEEKYLEFQIENPTEIVSSYEKNKEYDLSEGKHIIPYILNGKEAKTDIKDSDGNIIYQAPRKDIQKKVMDSGKLPKEYDVVLLTYSQIRIAEKSWFIKQIADNNLVILDESHNASGSSTTGENLAKVIKYANCLFLSATFAKRPDNMPIYAMKTAMQESNLTSDGLKSAMNKGGVALQEVLSAQLVAEGQMIRRERTYEGIEVNYITLDENGGDEVSYKDDLERMYQNYYCRKEVAKLDTLKADSITEVIRQIISFEDNHVYPRICTMADDLAKSQTDVDKTKGTSQAGIDSTPYFSKVFNIVNQMLFALKAEAVADRAIMRLKQGKKPVIAFSNTMGSFVESIESTSEFSDSEVAVNADFAVVLIKGLESTLKYTVTGPEGEKSYEKFDISDLGRDAQEEYERLINVIYKTSSGLVISPIDLIKKRITEAGYVVAEVTGRKLQVRLEQQKGKPIEFKSKKASGTKIPRLVDKVMNNVQKSIVRQSDEFKDVVLDIEKNVKGLPKLYFYSKEQKRRLKEGELNLEAKDIHIAHLHYFIGGSDWYITEWDGEDSFFGFSILNGNYEDAEFGYINLTELLEYRGERNSIIELDFYWTPKTISEILNSSGLGRRNKKGLGEKVDSGKRWVGWINNRTVLDAKDAFWGFNNNKIDVLLLNQSGSTGTSAHAVATKLVAPKDAKQRVMIVLQSELNVNTEMQKRGRINRTGQLIKPIYDYITSAIPAENRLMMMLKKKLKSLDANTSSNQKNSESILKSNDFLNKYGDQIVGEYLFENRKINKMLGNPLRISDGDLEAPRVADAALKVSGRVAILKCKDQRLFYNEVLDLYHTFVENKVESGEYDLEVEVMNLKARTIERKVIIDGTGGKSSFGTSTFEERCEVNELKKPYTSKELIAMLEKELNGKSPSEYSKEWISKAKAILDTKMNERKQELTASYSKQIASLKDLSSIKNAEDPTIAFSEKKTYLMDALKLDIEKEEEKATNRLFFLTDKVFNCFKVGDIISLPEIYSNPTEDGQLGVFVGFQINEKKDNPFTNGNIKLKFVIASGKRSRTYNLTGDAQNWVNAIRNAASFGRYDFETITYKWNSAVRKNYTDRTERFIITGNLLQAFGDVTLADYKMKLIQFSTDNGSVRKGILMPESYNPSKSKEGANNAHKDMVKIPIGKAFEVISAMPMNKAINTSVPLSIQRNRNLDYLFIYKPAKNSPNIHLDRDVLAFVEGNEFNKATTVFKATVVQSELESLLLCLQNKYNLSILTDRYTLNSVGYEFNEGYEDDSRKEDAPEPLFVKSLLEKYNELLEI